MSETKTDARGLEPAAQNQEPPRGRPLTPADVGTVQLIPLELLHRSPYQVRREGDVAELAADIKAHGLVNPITVRKRAQNDGFEVVAGHRRWAAMKLVDPDGEAPCIVLDVDDRTAEELLIAENFVRADLSIMEQAETVALLTLHGRTAEECGKVCRRSVRWAHRMRAIGGIGEPWRGFLHAAGLPYACALAVARLPEALREGAWRAYWDEVANDLNAAGEAEVLAGLAGDWSALKGGLAHARDPGADLPDGLDLSTDRGARTLLQFGCASVYEGDRFALDDPRGPLGGVFDGLHVLSRAPFDCGGACARCARRTDRAPDLFAEDDGRATPPRCLDGACWRRRVEEAVRARLDEAAAAGAAEAEHKTSVYEWELASDWSAALEQAGGDAARVTPVVEMRQDGPTGRVFYRVAPTPENVMEEVPPPAPPKREPWEEWTPANPRWRPMLMGDRLAAAWFCVGLLVGRSYHADADDENADYWRLRPWRDLSVDDVGALLARCNFVNGLGERRADFLVADAANLAPTDADNDAIRAAWRTWLKARKHLPAKGGDDDAGEAWEDGDNE